MSARVLEASVRREKNAAIIDLSGEINSFSKDILNAAYAEAAQTEPNTILLNFTQVDYINSTGIALIVGLLAEARKGQLRLGAYGLSDHYEEIFQITRLSDYITIYPDEESALAEAV